MALIRGSSERGGASLERGSHPFEAVNSQQPRVTQHVFVAMPMYPAIGCSIPPAGPLLPTEGVLAPRTKQIFRADLSHGFLVLLLKGRATAGLAPIVHMLLENAPGWPGNAHSTHGRWRSD
jgi:hypothetical protein